MFTGAIPPAWALGPLQDEVMAAAEDLRELLPGETAEAGRACAAAR